MWNFSKFLSKRRSGLSSAEIDEFESIIHLSIPKCFRDFLEYSDGGSVELGGFVSKCEIPGGREIEIQGFYSFKHQEPTEEGLVERLETVVRAIPPDAFPVAWDDFGNDLVIDYTGSVFFLVCEAGSEFFGTCWPTGISIEELFEILQNNGTAQQ